MLKRLNRLILLAIIVGLALYIVLLNRSDWTVHFSPSRSLTSSGGIVLIAVFCLGALCAALIAAFFGIKAYWRERTLLNREKQQQELLRSILEARGCIEGGEWGKALDLWRRIARREPANTLANLEMARCLEGVGEKQEALKVIEGVRRQEPHNIEALFRAAALNLVLGNKTAAIDNLALILYHHPVKKAALMARNLSEELGRIDDALQYQAHLEKLGEGDEQNEENLARLHFKKTLLDTGTDKAALADQLRALLKRNPEFAPAMQKLAELEKEAGAFESAAQLLVKAGTVSKDAKIWRQAIILWLNQNEPERALAAARTAVKETRGEGRLQAELELIRLYLDLRMLEEAKKAIAAFPKTVKQEALEAPLHIMQGLLVLKGRCLSALGDYKGLDEIWKKLADASLTGLPASELPPAERPAPSPVWSTP